MDFFFMQRMLRHDLDWYESHFKPADEEKPKPVRGELSPRYARLKAWQVNRLAEFLPNLRIVLTLRHPIERVWSQTLYDFGRLQGRDIRKVGILEILRQLERARSRLSADYDRTARIWSQAFGREALHIDFFDRLRDAPAAFIDRILKHIGASTAWTLPEEFVKKKIWATNTLVQHEREIPEIVQWYIADQLLKPTERLNNFLEGQVGRWVDELRTIRGNTKPGWRILRELNRVVLSTPERLAYDAYHSVLDTRLRLRWRQLDKAYRTLSTHQASRSDIAKLQAQQASKV